MTHPTDIVAELRLITTGWSRSTSRPVLRRRLVEAADLIDRYRKETGGLCDTHPGLIAKALNETARACHINHDGSIKYYTRAELAALRAATFEVTE